MITAIGNPVYDYIKTQKIDTQNRVLSGCSTNAALALTRLGETVRLIGAIGNDYIEHFKTKLADLKIENHIIESESSGGFSLIYYDDFGNRTLDLLGRASDIGNLDPKLYSDSQAVLIAPILGEVTLEQISEIRKNFDGLFFCDPQGLLRDADDSGRIFHEKRDGIEQALSNFDVVKPNELEAKVLTGIDCRKDPYRAAENSHRYTGRARIGNLRRQRIHRHTPLRNRPARRHRRGRYLHGRIHIRVSTYQRPAKVGLFCFVCELHHDRTGWPGFYNDRKRSPVSSEDSPRQSRFQSGGIIRFNPGPL